MYRRSCSPTPTKPPRLRRLAALAAKTVACSSWARTSVSIVMLCITAASADTACCTDVTPANPDSRPNVILIMADDMGYGDLSCYGGWIKTPHLDRLAANSLRFTDFHSNGTVCSPTRASLMTGRYPEHVGIPRVVVADPNHAAHRLGIPAREWTMAEAFRAAGYRTALFGKWHLGYAPQFNPTQHGFEQFRGYLSGNVDFFTHIDQAGNFDWWNGQEREDDPGYVTRLITKYALDFLDHATEAPFFLYLPHEAPHYPYQGPNDPPIRQPDGAIAIRQTRGKERNRQAYREMVTELDRSVGQVMNKLREMNLEPSTIVWFLSDNGASRYLGSNGPLRGFKGQVWEGGHRVPSFVSWPGKIDAGTTAATAASFDLFPTFAQLASLDLTPTRPLDGIDISPTLLRSDEDHDRRQPSSPNRVLVWGNGTAQAVRRGKWKLVLPGENQSPQLFRFDAALPKETDNVAQSFPNVVNELMPLTRR